MAIVTEYDWESDTFTHHAAENAARTAWREAVAEIAEKAKATLPDCAGRVDRAVAIVLNHDVELLDDGQVKVASQSNGTVVYHLVNGECSCKDYAKAPSNWCKHRIAVGLYKRATALVQRKLAPHTNGTSNGQVDAPPAPDPAQAQAAEPAHADVPTAPFPEAPASVNVRLEVAGREVQLTLRDSDEGRLLQRLDAMLQRFPAAAMPTDTTPQCPTHGAMKPSTKGKGWYCPHKLADGSWCKAK